MKKRIKEFFRQLLETVKASPGESVLILLFCLFTTLLIEDVDFVQGSYVALYPLFFTLTFLLNRWCPSGVLRWIYYLSPLVALPFVRIDVQPWVNSTAYAIALVICPFLVFYCRRQRDNALFVADVLHYLKNVFFASVLAGMAFLLVLGIYYSLKYIFPSLPLGNEEKVISYFSLFFFTALQPLLILTFIRRQRDDYRPMAAFDILVNYVLSPALLVYTVILYAYFLKILFTWSLPRGGISYMVFVFTLLAVLVKAYQPLVARRLYDWFFNRFSLVSLPALAMFWVGTGYRISQYGFTEERIYLLLSGAVMTFVALMFLTPRIGRYLYATLLAVALFSVFTFIPSLSADDIARRSQTERFETIAARLGMFGADGKLITRKLPPADSLNHADYETAYDAFEYLYRNTEDSLLEARYGYGSLYELSEAVFPENFSYNSRGRGTVEVENNYLYLDRDSLSLDLHGYSRLHRVLYGPDNKGYTYATPGDLLILYAPDGQVLFRESYAKVLAAQLAKMNLSDTVACSELENRSAEFLVYDHAPWRVLFSSVSLSRDSVLLVTDISVDFLLEK